MLRFDRIYPVIIPVTLSDVKNGKEFIHMPLFPRRNFQNTCARIAWGDTNEG